MHMTTYQVALRRLQPIVPILFQAFQAGLDASLEEHDRRRLQRRGDQHYFSHTARRVICERLRASQLLVTDAANERSVLPMSGIQVQYGEAVIWVFKAKDDEVPLPDSARKQAFYRQEGTLDGWDNLLLLWSDVDGVLKDPMHLVRPLGGDHLRRNLRLDWEGPLSSRMGAMRPQDLDGLRPRYEWKELEGD
jgi:hypothetical protein